MIIHPEIQDLAVEIDRVKPWHRNSRSGDVGAISESLRINGQYKPILVQKSSGKIIAGNHTWRAARALKWEEIAVQYLDLTDTEAERIVLVDNRTNDLASYDYDVLRDQLQALPDLAGTGYTLEDIESLGDLVDEPLTNEPADPVLSAMVRFDNEQQQQRWYAFIRHLREMFPNAQTDAVRVDEFLVGVLDTD